MSRAKISRVDTIYIFERLWGAINRKTHKETIEEVVELMIELSVNYRVETGQNIGEGMRQYIVNAIGTGETK